MTTVQTVCGSKLLAARAVLVETLDWRDYHFACETNDRLAESVLMVCFR